MRSLHLPGRSPVYGRKAMVATSHPTSTLAAIDMLRRGGNAVDAAITAAAVQCVVEHPMSGIGGDCFAIVASPGGAITALNASGRAPMAATPEWYERKGMAAIEVTSPHAVTVPGAVDGWARLLSDHGTRSLADCLAPAIEHAATGFIVTPRVAVDWQNAKPKIMANAGARAHLLIDGRVPRAGEVMRMPALARTLEAIARDGRDAFYSGPIARDMVATLAGLGGLHTEADFARQSSSYVETLSVRYGDLDVHELPPNNHGIVALILLKMLARLGRLSESPTAPERYHVMMEAARLAYAMRDTFVADPELARVPVAHMLDDAVIEELVRRIDRTRKSDLGPVPQPAGSDTICLSVVDESGLAVSFINSLFADFGTGITTAESGIVLHNRAQGFVLDRRHPNAIGPGKRPLHTLVPAMAMRDGRPALAFGVMGAAFQPMGHAYLLNNLLDYGLDIQQAIDCPRVFFEGSELLVEEGVPAATMTALAGRGHKVSIRTLPWGGAQAVEITRDGVLIGGSDARKDGCAMGY